MSSKRSVGGICANGGMLLAFLICFMMSCVSCSPISKNGKNSLPAMDKRLVNEGYSTAAMVYYDQDLDDVDENPVKILCSMVYIGEKRLITSLHCLEAIQEELQKNRDKREEKMKEDIKDCDEMGEMLGICGGDAVKHQKVELMGINVHFFNWEEDMGLNREPAAWHLGRLIKMDKKHDLALIEMYGNNVHHGIVRLAKGRPAVGSVLDIVGHPARFEWTFLKGSVSGYRDYKMNDVDGPFMQVQFPGYGGNSGGGAFNSEGELVGIADMVSKVPDTAFFTHTDTIRDFLKD